MSKVNVMTQAELRLVSVPLSYANGGGTAYRVQFRRSWTVEWRTLEEYYNENEALTDFSRRVNAMTSKKHRYLGRGE